MNKDIWTDRQVMLGKSAFEFYHYLDEIPPKVEYSLSAQGKTLIPILNVMCDWGREYMARNEMTETCCGKEA